METTYIVKDTEGNEVYRCDSEMELYKWLDQSAEYYVEYEIETKLTFVKRY